MTTDEKLLHLLKLGYRERFGGDASLDRLILGAVHAIVEDRKAKWADKNIDVDPVTGHMTDTQRHAIEADLSRGLAVVGYHVTAAFHVEKHELLTNVRGL